MAFSSIPNQPILFNNPIFAGQTCLNNDTRAYAQLLQAGDTMCIQLENVADLSTYNLQPLTIGGNILTNGDFSNNLNGWHQGVIATSTDDGPWPWGSSFDWYLNNGGAQKISSGTKGLGRTIPGTIGDVFLISFYFETYQGIGAIQTYLGDFNANSWNSTIYNGSDPLNFDNRYTVILSSYAGLDLWFDGTTSGTKPLIKNIKVYNIPSLLFVADVPFTTGWMYVESCNGYQVMNTGYTITSTNNLFSGTNYELKFKIKNLIGGSFDIFDYDGNLIVSATENKEYNVYFTYTGTDGPFSIEINNANAVNGIIYDFEIGTQCYDHRIKLVNPNNNSESKWFDKTDLDFPIQYYDNKIIWCFDMQNINDFDTGDPLQTGCFKVRIDDCGNGEIDSYTTINYTTGTHECTVWMEGECKDKAFDFVFNSSTSNIQFTLGQRLRLLQFNPIYPIKAEEYLYSNGYHIRTYAETSKKREAWFDYVDEPTHDTIRLQLLCDTLTIDGKEYYFVSSDYQPEWAQNGKYNLAQSRVELMAVEEKTLFNKSCI